MKKIKEFMKKYLMGFILGVISAAVVVVYAETYFPSNQVTYDNKESGMTSDNVQTAIDELYNTCFPPKAGDQIIENAGLEKDPYECRYFFTGGSPNNYITFNNETAGWRIISVECDGRIKIMRTTGIEPNQKWDTGGSNNWARPATLNTYLNETYFNSLNEISQNQIVTSDFSIGGTSYDTDDMSIQISDENSAKWEGKIALSTVSEYIRTNSNKESCGTVRLNNNNYSNCKNTTWMYIYNMTATLTPYYDSRANYLYIRIIYDSGVVSTASVYEYKLIRPALYLSSDVKLSGSGTQSDPYVVS